jgi:hypothetical protein
MLLGLAQFISNTTWAEEVLLAFANNLLEPQVRVVDIILSTCEEDALAD